MEKELNLAVKNLMRNKACGLDGLTAEFYIMFYSKIKTTLLNAINAACTETGKLHDSAIRGVITLIPKKQRDCRYIENMRPISPFCTDYEIVEKMSANRLKPVL